MNRITRKIIFLLIITTCFGSISASFSQSTPAKYWIYFDTKEMPVSCKVAPKALQRRQKMDASAEVDCLDWPVSARYLAELRQLGIEPIVESRWFNAISAMLTPEQKLYLQKLSFIKKITPVQRFQRKPVSAPQSEIPSLHKAQEYQYDYGASLVQNEMIAVPEVHDLGIFGEGVLILMLDTGFNYKQHLALNQLDVLAEYDFIFSDSVTANEDGQDSGRQHSHGTETFSTIGAFQPGELIGPAFGARYLLAKTEYVESETEIEEDFWVAGLEWGERMGADIASSSLGYNDWYEYSALGGDSAITTLAADLAVERGMIVVNSMGNEGNWAGSIIAPADGYNVIAVGAVNSENVLTGFSSIGPTWDRRIKPDVVALGSAVRVVQPNSSSAFTYASGTSFSCPLVAGVVALVLSAHPDLTPLEVRDALRNTADNAGNPNNEIGWGLVNAMDAILYHGPVFSAHPVVENIVSAYKTIKIKVKSRFGIGDDKVRIYVQKIDKSFEEMGMIPTPEENQYEATFPTNDYGEIIRYYFSVEDSIGKEQLHPYHAPNALFETDGDLTNPELVKKFILYQNFPNPFHLDTQIKFHLPEKCRVNLAVYNLRQQLVKDLVNREMEKGSHFVVWDGRDRFGKLIASGTYQLWMSAKGISETKLMEFIRLELLEQNHPNPFNQSTRISYKVPVNGLVNLSIYNIQGQKIAILLNKQEDAGEYEILWNGENNAGKVVPSGIYFYVLEVDGMYYTRKLTLIR